MQKLMKKIRNKWALNALVLIIIAVSMSLFACQERKGIPARTQPPKTAISAVAVQSPVKDTENIEVRYGPTMGYSVDAFSNVSMTICRKEGVADIYFDFDASKLRKGDGGNHLIFAFHDKNGYYLNAYNSSHVIYDERSRNPMLDQAMLQPKGNHIRLVIRAMDAAYAQNVAFCLAYTRD